MVTQRARTVPPSRAKRIAARRRKRLVWAWASVAAVVVVVAAFVIVKLSSSSSPSKVQTGVTALAPQSVVDGLAGIPATDLAQATMATKVAGPSKITAPALQSGGKPEVLYVGAEYCPYCAAERWPVVVALSQFGKFANLGTTYSASADVYPNTATFSFHGATYSSPYLSFAGLETRTNQPSGGSYAPLDTLTPEQEQLIRTYDAPPYVSADAAGTIPWVDFGGQAVLSGSQYDPTVLAGKSVSEIASAAADRSSPIGKEVQAAAGVLVRQICTLTGGQPGSVCAPFAGNAGG